MELQGCYKLEFMCIDIAVSRSSCSVCPPQYSLCRTLARASVCVCVCVCQGDKIQECIEFTKIFHKSICTKSITIYVLRKTGGKGQNRLRKSFYNGPDLQNVIFKFSSVRILVENIIWLSYLEMLSVIRKFPG